MNGFKSLFLLFMIEGMRGQEYEVTDIKCRSGKDELLSARIRKPAGFMGVPIFIDARNTNPITSVSCQIRPDISDYEGLSYNLLVSDFTRCGTIQRSGNINVRVGFPMLPGIVMSEDQEVIIMCKPENQNPPISKETVTRKKLNSDYSVSIYSQPDIDGGSEFPVLLESAPIGARLQLIAAINTKSVWKYVKLVDVTLSPHQRNAKAPGHITIFKNGCIVEDFKKIIKDSPKIYENSPGEVIIELEAVMLDSNRFESSKLWIFVKSKACRSQVGCEPSICQPRSKRNIEDELSKEQQQIFNTTDYQAFQERVYYKQQFDDPLLSNEQQVDKRLSKGQQKDRDGRVQTLQQQLNIQGIGDLDLKTYGETSIMTRPKTAKGEGIMSSVAKGENIIGSLAEGEDIMSIEDDMVTSASSQHFYYKVKETDDFEYYPSKSSSEEEESKFLEDISVFEEGIKVLETQLTPEQVNPPTNFHQKRNIKIRKRIKDNGDNSESILESKEESVDYNVKTKDDLVLVREDTMFVDNVGITILLPTDDIYAPMQSSKASPILTNLDKKHEDCNTFLAIGVAMGCLLIVASVMMCFLAQKLRKSVAQTKYHSTEAFLQRERNRFGFFGSTVYRSDA